MTSRELIRSSESAFRKQQTKNNQTVDINVGPIIRGYFTTFLLLIVPVVFVFDDGDSKRLLPTDSLSVAAASPQCTAYIEQPETM